MTRLGAVADRPKVVGALLVTGLVLTVVFTLLSGFFGTLADFGPALYFFAALLPVVGTVVVFTGGYWYARTKRADSDRITTAMPETGATAARKPARADIEQSLRSAASNRYRCRQHSSGDRIEEILRAGAIQRVRTRDGHDYETARSLVAAGDWTADPVAAALLSEQTAYPLLERLRGALDPGQAYWRRVERTLAVIEAGTEQRASDDARTEAAAEPREVGR
jgi:hypothetical protein